jgi:hypothetical protein
VRATCPASLVLFDMILLIILAEEYKSRSPSLCSFLSLHPFSVLTFSSAPCSQTPSFYIIVIIGKTGLFEAQPCLEDSAKYVLRFSLLWMSQQSIFTEQVRQPWVQPPNLEDHIHVFISPDDLSLYSSRNIRNQISFPYETTDKCIISCSLILGHAVY